MNIRPNELDAALASGLAPFYFLSGDEFLQLNEAADAVRRSARKKGFHHREVFEIGANFNWKLFTNSLQALSLFDDKKIVELRLSSSSPGSEGAKAIVNYLENPSEDIIVLMIGPKIGASVRNSKWFLALSQKAAIVLVWPLEGPRLTAWIKQRLLQKGITCDQQALSLLTSRVEGNLLAAAQEIDKLYVLNGEGHIDANRIRNLVFDHARYDVFKLLDSVLQGNTVRSLKILRRLKQEDIPPPLILWGLMKETRVLSQLTFNLRKGRATDRVLRDNKIWDNRQPLLLNAAKRLNGTTLHKILRLGSDTDCSIKGLNDQDPWNGLFAICVSLCGSDSPALTEKSIVFG